MSTLFGGLIVLVILSLPVLGAILVIRALKKKPLKKLVIAMAICVGSIVPLTILGVLTSPSTWCNHEYVIIEEVAPTCAEKGKVVKECTLCERTTVEHIDMLPHSWGEEIVVAATCVEKGTTTKKCSTCGKENVEYIDEVSHSWTIDSVVNATCTSKGHTVKKCENCSTTRETNATDALGHAMREVSRKEPTYDVEGEIVRKCDRCEHKEVESIPKLEAKVIKFNGLELIIGDYSFTEVDNRYSEQYGEAVVRIPVTIKNVSRDPQALYAIYYKLFGTSGVESANVGYYFSDDVSNGGDLLPGTSYTKYFHIVYDGDGVYTIVLDNLLFDKETIKIEVKK